MGEEPEAFDTAAAAVAGQINRLPKELPKLVAAQDFMEAQPVMFLTRSYTDQQQSASNRYPLNPSCAEAASLHPQFVLFCLPAP